MLNNLSPSPGKTASVSLVGVRALRSPPPNTLNIYVSLKTMAFRLSPSWPQEGPTQGQDDPEMVQEGPEVPQDGPNMAQGRNSLEKLAP